jgi:predicted MFS family arabinose efflux permease
VSGRDGGGTSLLVLLCVTAFASTFSFGAFPALLPELGRAGRLSDGQLGTLVGVFGFARMAVDVPAGLFIARRLRAALLVAPLLLTAGTLALAAGTAFETLVLARILMGAGHALEMIAALTAILRYCAGWHLGAALNAFELSAMLGILGGVGLLGALPPTLSWNWALLVACAPQLLGLVVLPFVLAAVPPDPRETARSPLTPRPPASTTVGPAASGGAGLAFAAGGAFAVTYSTVELFLVPLRSSREFGLDRTGVARLLMVTQLCDIVALVPIGLVADRRDVGRVLAAVLLVMAVATGLTAFGGLSLLFVGCALLGLGMAGWMLPLGLLRRATAPEQVAWRTALYRVGVDGGMFAGPFAAGLLGGGHVAALALAISVALVGIAGLLATRPRGG